MCEQTEVDYLDGEVVWVKLGSCWWPGEVVSPEKLPPDVLPSFRKPPIAVVKFFQEDTYEYVKNVNSIYKYNCSRKNEFINKGLYMYRTKHGHMEKFPEDIIRAETAVGGDIEILTRDEFQERKKESYAGIFGDPKKTPASVKRVKGGKARPVGESPRITPIRKLKEKVDYKVHILVQGSKTPASSSENPLADAKIAPESIVAPSTSVELETENKEEQPQSQQQNEEIEKPELVEKPATTFSTPVASSSGIYSCHACSFSTSRLNVLILHNKTHSVSFTPYTPSPVRKKISSKSSKSTPNSSKTPKVRRPRKEKSDKEPKKSSSSNKKRAAEEQAEAEAKKIKTDEEIKSSLLADWDDGDEESNEDSSAMVMAGSPEVPEAAESPAVPTSAELSSLPMSGEISPTDKKSNSSPTSEKPESSSDSKYEFCEDEDWPLEADAGRKIPRVKNPKRKEDTKSLSLDDDDVAREVAELLNKTTVPELPSAPEPLKVEENFPEPSIVKSPDKRENTPEKSAKSPSEGPPTRAIFKTKTFFRSRHSRSQDAIGKYVAEQLNAVERMDISESEINGSEVASSPEARDSPPIEHVKVARLAPKIQLKKMKAELREKERSNYDHFNDGNELNKYADIKDTQDTSPELESTPTVKEKENKQQDEILQGKEHNEPLKDKLLTDVLYPTREIKPVNADKAEQMKPFTSKVEIVEDSSLKEESSIEEKPVKDIIEAPEVAQDIATVPKASQEPIKEMETVPVMKFPDTSLQKTYEQSIGPYMNESTASAVDALLSVSREADRVTRNISDDPPEDLFEDDNKDNSATCNNINGFNEIVNEVSTVAVDKDVEQDKFTEDNNELKNDLNEFTNNEKSQDSVDENILIQDSVMHSTEQDVGIAETIVESAPSESVLQIAETLINLPSTAIQNKACNEIPMENLTVALPQEPVLEEDCPNPGENISVDEKSQDSIPEPEPPNHPTKSLLISNNENLGVRFETEQEKSENLNAAQSLVQMSETIDHKINIDHNLNSTVNNKDKTESTLVKQNNGLDSINSVEHKIAMLSNDNNSEGINSKSVKTDTSSSKLLKILEEPCTPKATSIKSTPTKQLVIPGKEKILNFDVAKSTFKGKTESPKQKIIIRRTAPSKNIINNMNEITGPEKIILSRSNNPAQDGSVQTYTIQTTPEASSDSNTIIIQQKIRKIAKPPSKLQKIKPQNSLVAPMNESKIINETTTDDAMFDINSMPIVLSEDLLTAESIEKMPIVMSDGNIISHAPNPPKLVKTKQPVDNDKVAISATPNKPEVKTLLMNPVTEVSKVTTPNILSKSSKLRGAKPMLVIDKTTGKQKIIMAKGDATVKEVKQAPTLIQPVPQNTGKGEKFIILPTPSSPRPGRTQKIVIDPQTGKAHVLVTKGPEAQMGPADNKQVSAKLIPSSSDASTPGSTVMIITNAQGAQSRIVLTPEHEKMLFPKKQQTNVSQLKTITHRISTNAGGAQKTMVTTVAQGKTQNLMPAKTPARIVPKQKSAIITSKGQLIVGGRVATTAQNIAPMPEIRPVPKRIMASEPKKLVQAIQKSSSETLIFLQQKSGAVMQLTAAQFEHLQRTGQIIQKTTAPMQDNKVVLPKKITISPNESAATTVHKPRVRKTVMESPTPMKKHKQEIAIAPAPAPLSPLPALTPLTNTAPAIVPSVSNTVCVTTTSSYSDFDNFEELLPSTAIVRQQEPIVHQAPAPEQPVAASPASLSDGQLLAVPGEHFGGPPGSFYLCVEDNGTLTPIDNRPLVLENNQLVPMAVEPLPVLAQPERRDILEAALANSDVFHADTARDEAPDFRDLNANVSVHCRVSETSTTLNQPIMTPVEVPTKVDSEPAVPSNLEAGLAVIGVTPHTVPTSLELPITVTDPRIAPKTTDPLSGNNYGTTLLPSPNTDMTFVTTEETVDVPMVPIGGPISMPLLTEEESVGKSMPILTDDVTDRTVSSVESTVGSPSSLEVRESETEDGGQWTRRLLTPGSDTSEASAEIPLQPAIQLSVNELSRNS